ncbi:hypothetical protein BJP08_03595 [Corynebacterium sp. NML140438]|uniref:prepilin peptidase n=1 Tax=Corynebacterium sp. NML140438 TaxID=1906334 RepID=UPI0008FB61C2|nr:prepilin peptidase [Corynebacterium sp. NML140438]OIR42408.1 hypothetical protein BJP08_03595 [Corynebacterium sp. NML140438]
MGGVAWIGVVLAGGWSALLCWYDLKYARLPDFLTLPASVLALSAIILQPVLFVGALWPAVYLLVGRGIGGGDAKLALPLGVAAAACGGFIGIILAIFLSSFCTLCFALFTRSCRVPHGPSMLLACWALIGLYLGNGIFWGEV